MTVRIFQKIPNNMQRGKANANGWILEHNVAYACRADPLMGWQGSGDTRGQVTLRFPDRESAIAFAKRERLDYQVMETPSARSEKLQSYAENFQGRVVETPGS